MKARRAMLTRLPNNPIITINDHTGDNVNGPSLIRVPDWLPNPLGRYYLYFAHHQGEFIRLAYADDLHGPWTIYRPGTLQLEQTPCRGHIASPDVHIDDENRRIIMYFHGPVTPSTDDSDSGGHPWSKVQQRTFVATSSDGIHFESGDEILGLSYFRVFRWGGYVYALGMPGYFYRSADGLTNFERGPRLFNDNMRHTALDLDGDTLTVYFTQVGDTPEHILRSQIQLTPDWHTWQESAPVSVLKPEMAYEGVNEPIELSQRGSIHHPAHQLRDPAVFTDVDGAKYLLYSVAGEQGIAIAQLA